MSPGSQSAPAPVPREMQETVTPRNPHGLVEPGTEFTPLRVGLPVPSTAVNFQTHRWPVDPVSLPRVTSVSDYRTVDGPRYLLYALEPSAPGWVFVTSGLQRNAHVGLYVARLEAEGCQRPVRNRKVEILAPIVIQVIGLLMVPLRLYARWTTVHRIETDDWIIAFCALVFIVFVVFGQLAGWVAFGEDIWMVDSDKLTLGFKIFFIDESFYLTCLGLTKISVLFFYLRIFPNKSFRYATYATMSYIGLSTTILLFMQIFQCIPFSYNWDGWKGDFGPHSCLNMNVLAFVAAGVSISHDIIILLLPIPLLWHLNMGLRSKLSIFIMFSLGIFILITSCVRLRYITLFTRSLNPTWDFTDPLIWSGVEVSVSMIVVCLPTMRILLKRAMPKLFASMASVRISAPKKASNTSSRLGQCVKSVCSGGHKATAARMEERRNRAFTLQSVNSKLNESELELGDKFQGEVRTQIRFGDVESSRGRNSTESGIHVHTTTTFGDMDRDIESLRKLE
ncbi:putative CFEM domain-containing protein [Colletotrichum sublineola]|uniref:Putative CFEM domain-containing protein n=1 Tax=Colletotrichum sublineola TaxID=1173701 RepID=A0A066X866_COLSU|nr:putative CFEM domain-containing protein [Colletotrichum sublineola]